jgi:hypothetical protein
MKTIISAIVIVVLMIGAPSIQIVLANKAHENCDDSCQEAGIASDKMGRVCDFGPSHDECRDQFLERTNDLPILPPNQHYGECEAVGPNNELGCDILNDDGSPNPGN